LPRRNAKDLAELPGVVRDGMELIQVDSLEQVLAAALLPKTQTGPVPVQVA
jgi:ATP-dependent Lon protease